MRTRCPLAILAASALLLSCASNAQPSSQKNISQTKQYSEENNTGSTPATPITDQHNPDVPATKGNPETYSYSGTFNYRLFPAPPQSVWTVIGSVASIVSAFLVMVFTGCLVRISYLQWTAITRQAEALDKTLVATQKAADAAKQAADAAVLTSLPHVEVLRFAINGLERLDYDPVADPRISFSFVNFGKTPAFVTQMCLQSHFGNKLPPAPEYTNRAAIDRAMVVPAEKELPETVLDWFTLFDKYVLQQDFEPVRRGQHKIFLYGFLDYVDVFDAEYTAGFAVEWQYKTRSIQAILPAEAPKFIYHRRKRPPDA